MNDVTHILHEIERGDSQAADKLLTLVYEELRKLAARKMAHETPGQTLQATALVHEAWLRLVGTNSEVQFKNRAYFFGAAAEAMRRILIDRARRKHAIRHGGGQQRLDIQEIDVPAQGKGDDLLALDEAINKLVAHDKMKAEVVKLRYFIGLTIEETAEILGISEPTAKRYWQYARAWLHTEIKSTQAAG